MYTGRIQSRHLQYDVVTFLITSLCESQRFMFGKFCMQIYHEYLVDYETGVWSEPQPLPAFFFGSLFSDHTQIQVAGRRLMSRIADEAHVGEQDVDKMIRTINTQLHFLLNLDFKSVTRLSGNLLCAAVKQSLNQDDLE